MQNELFEVPITPIHDSSSQKLVFLERYRFSLRMDQALIVIISMIMIYVFVFSFGVEKGKQFALTELKAERVKREMMVEELSKKLMEKEFPQAQDSAGNANKNAGVAKKEEKLANVLNADRDNPKEKTAVEPSTENPGAKSGMASDGKYTIQIVTYTNKNKSTADVALKEISKKGLNGFVVSTGEHWILCLDRFKDQTSAKQVLERLKTQKLIPPDAFIRPIPA